MLFEEYGKGQCINCGFLCKRYQESNVAACFQTAIVDRTEEATANLYRHVPLGALATITVPWCFVNMANLAKEAAKLQGEAREDHVKHKYAFQVIATSRDCPKWYEYRELVTPQEHFSMYLEEKREQERREYEQRVEEVRKKFEEKLSEQNQETINKFNTTMIWLTVILIVVAFLQLAILIVQLT